MSVASNHTEDSSRQFPEEIGRRFQYPAFIYSVDLDILKVEIQILPGALILPRHELDIALTKLWVDVI